MYILPRSGENLLLARNNAFWSVRLIGSTRPTCKSDV